MRLCYYWFQQNFFLMPCVTSHYVRLLFFASFSPPFDPGNQVTAFQQRLAAAPLGPELPSLKSAIKSRWAGYLMRGIGMTDFGIGVKNIRVQGALFLNNLNHTSARDFSF